MKNNKLDSATNKFVEGLKKADLGFQNAQKQIIAMQNSGMTLKQIEKELVNTKLDGIDLEKFLAADTMEKMVHLVAELFDPTV
jgi:hypothetical protein